MCFCVSIQVSSLARDNERDSYHLSWATDNLDNVALSSSPLHSGWVLSSSGINVWTSPNKSSLNVLDWFLREGLLRSKVLHSSQLPGDRGPSERSKPRLAVPL